MLIVADNVLDAQSLWEVQDYYKPVSSRYIHWVDGTLKEMIELQSPLSEILSIAACVFDLSNMSGVEQWAHDGTKPDWHVDKDEVLFNRTGALATPLCSIVFYASVNSLVGGKFMTDDVTVTPKTNRMLAFGPGVHHGVEDFTGVRVAVAINAWATKPYAS